MEGPGKTATSGHGAGTCDGNIRIEAEGYAGATAQRWIGAGMRGWVLDDLVEETGLEVAGGGLGVGGNGEEEDE